MQRAQMVNDMPAAVRLNETRQQILATLQMRGQELANVVAYQVCLCVGVCCGYRYLCGQQLFITRILYGRIPDPLVSSSLSLSFILTYGRHQLA